MKGDCFVANCRAMAMVGGGDTLCHGIVTGQGPIEGVEYAHCWMELGDEVIDKSNGRDIRMPKSLYYALGNIDESTVVKYDHVEAIEKLLEHEHYGPWDIEDPSLVTHAHLHQTIAGE